MEVQVHLPKKAASGFLKALIDFSYFPIEERFQIIVPRIVFQRARLCLPRVLLIQFQVPEMVCKQNLPTKEGECFQ